MVTSLDGATALTNVLCGTLRSRHSSKQKEVDEGGRAQAAVSELQKELEATRAARDAAQKRADAAERARELARAELAAKLSLAESEAASK